MGEAGAVSSAFGVRRVCAVAWASSNASQIRSPGRCGRRRRLAGGLAVGDEAQYLQFASGERGVVRCAVGGADSPRVPADELPRHLPCPSPPCPGLGGGRGRPRRARPRARPQPQVGRASMIVANPVRISAWSSQTRTRTGACTREPARARGNRRVHEGLPAGMRARRRKPPPACRSALNSPPRALPAMGGTGTRHDESRRWGNIHSSARLEYVTPLAVRSPGPSQ
jgi:hypothetical protein